MSLHVDIPTRSQIERLLAARHAASVSVYLPTDPASPGDAERIAFDGLAADAVAQLRAAEHAATEVAAIEEALADVAADTMFWRLQARSLAAFATAESLQTFRLPNRLASHVEASDRFHLKPLLRAVTFPQVAYVLALAQGSVRLVEVGPDLEPSEVEVPDLPADAASAAGKASLGDRSPSGRLQGSEGQKVRLRQYARQVDQALRPILTGQDVPLVLAAAQPLDAIFRSMASYPHLAPESIGGNPETTSDAELAAAARTVLDGLYAEQLRDVHARFERVASQGRTALDVGDVARAATFGAVDTVLVDIDAVVAGTIDETTGAIAHAEGGDAVSYGVVDEIARRVWLTGGRVLAVRADDIPQRGPVAAILRYPV